MPVTATDGRESEDLGEVGKGMDRQSESQISTLNPLVREVISSPEQETTPKTEIENIKPEFRLEKDPNNSNSYTLCLDLYLTPKDEDIQTTRTTLTGGLQGILENISSVQESILNKDDFQGLFGDIFNQLQNNLEELLVELITSEPLSLKQVNGFQIDGRDFCVYLKEEQNSDGLDISNLRICGSFDSSQITLSKSRDDLRIPTCYYIFEDGIVVIVADDGKTAVITPREEELKSRIVRHKMTVGHTTPYNTDFILIPKYERHKKEGEDFAYQGLLDYIRIVFAIYNPLLKQTDLSQIKTDEGMEGMIFKNIESVLTAMNQIKRFEGEDSESVVKSIIRLLSRINRKLTDQMVNRLGIVLDVKTNGFGLQDTQNKKKNKNKKKK